MRAADAAVERVEEWCVPLFPCCYLLLSAYYNTAGKEGLDVEKIVKLRNIIMCLEMSQFSSITNLRLVGAILNKTVF